VQHRSSFAVGGGRQKSTATAFDAVPKPHLNEWEMTRDASMDPLCVASMVPRDVEYRPMFDKADTID
jgi:hypothetical protein